jgi:hypothetical protein
LIGMAMYQLRLIDSTGRIAAVQRFSALTDEEALSNARERVKSSAQLKDFDLWQGERCVHAASRMAGKKKPGR